MHTGDRVLAKGTGRPRRRPRALAAAALAMAMAALAPAAPASAATIPVTSTAPAVSPTDGVCSLREAIAAAGSDRASGPAAGECPAGQGADTIVLAPRADYALSEQDNVSHGSNGLPALATDVTVRGNGAVIERTAGGPDLRFFAVLAGHLTLQDLTLRGGLTRAGDGGGAVYSRGFLTFDGVTLSGNVVAPIDAFGQSAGPSEGGAVLNDHGTLILANSTLTGNSAAGGRGGAVFNLDGPAVVANSSLVGNGAAAGGALYDLGSDPAGAGSGDPVPAVVTLSNSILAGSAGDASDVVSDQPASAAGGAANVQRATVYATAPNIVERAATVGGGTIDGTPIAADPRLGPLGDSAGPGMQTMAPQPGSPALGAGRAPGCPRADERGLLRPLGACELGAVELDPVADPLLSHLPRRSAAIYGVASNSSPIAGLRSGAAARAYSPSGLSHCYELVPLRRPTYLRDLTGSIVRRRDGRPFLIVQGIVAVTRLEARRTPAGLVYEMWGPPSQPLSYSGGIQASALARPPTRLSRAALAECGRGSGRAAPDLRRHGRPVSYRIEPRAIPARIGYRGPGGLLIPYQNYGHFYAQDLIVRAGVAVAHDYTPIAWTWVVSPRPCHPTAARCRNVGGGVARAMVRRGTTFVPSAVQPIVGLAANDPRSWVAAVYGRVGTGRERIYGWVVAAHHDGRTGHTIRHLACSSSSCRGG